MLYVYKKSKLNWLLAFTLVGLKKKRQGCIFRMNHHIALTEMQPIIGEKTLVLCRVDITKFLMEEKVVKLKTELKLSVILIYFSDVSLNLDISPHSVIFH